MKWAIRIGLLLSLLSVTVSLGQELNDYLPINIQNVENLQEISILDFDLDDNRNGIKQIVFHSSNELLYTLEFNESIRKWDMNSFEFIEVLNLPTEYATSFAIHPEGETIIYGGWDFEEQPDFATLNHWEISQEQNEILLREGDENIEQIEFNPDGNLFATTGWDNGSIQIWNSVSYEIVGILSGHSGSVTNIAFLTNNQLISSGQDGKINIWNISDGQITQVLEGYFFIIRPSGEILLYSTGHADEVYQIVQLSTDGTTVYAPYSISGSPFAFNQTGDILAGVEGGQIWLYDFQTGEKIIHIGEYGGNFPPPIGFSSDEHFLVVQNSLGSIAVWSIPAS
jgi:WD40 repeat protein